ncbi:MAG: D-glycero-beta-D-manno-heptose 1-phosphate adenylyltransferase [Candidatus Nanoarchaeia archaeon]
MVSELLKKFPEQTIAVVGDVMLDVTVHGDVNRISPEAPVPVVKQTRRTFAPGGAANVAANLAALGVKVVLYGLVGEDAGANVLMQALERRGVCCELVVTQQPTIEKTRILSQNQQLLRYDHEEKFTSGEDLLLEALSKLPPETLVLVSDYAKGTITKKIVETLRLKHKVIADPKPANKELYRGVYMITPNKSEAEAMCETEDVEGMGLELQRSLDANVIITTGPQGLSLFEKGTQAKNIPTTAKAVYDVTGAGDTFIATLAAGISTGAGLVDCCMLANQAAGIAVSKVGTDVVSVHELAARLTKTDTKIKSRDEMAGIVANLKAQGKTVVTTNGAFDVLHVGHLHSLRTAKKFGDILVLGLNTDASVQRYKGPERPIVKENERAEMLAGLGCVDYVVLFDEDTPCELLEAIRPDIHVKGGDYDPDNYEQMPESKVVRENGGRIEIVPLVPGFSTSDIITKIKEQN